MVQLSNPYQCQLALGAAEATATVVHPCIEMTTDAVTDQVVSGKDGNGKLITTTVIVGQQINLRAVLPAGVNVTGEQWTIPGTNGNSPFAIEKYTQSRGGGIVTAFAAQDPLLQGASVQYTGSPAAIPVPGTMYCHCCRRPSDRPHRRDQGEHPRSYPRRTNHHAHRPGRCKALPGPHEAVAIRYRYRNWHPARNSMDG